ncbi:hypothetical protein Afil01_07100 [Actinorhabdospora filicis]|uniref:Uncharacterized protein n=1 Tax=Actinorhabdospora filicis TaxID=1785913 RepID=A0A9W6SGJ9_9ACTN|nr:hypothetical protein [Actinorhabdospora filicis]GLZ75903.1 hypothetical protein Afil01_07100 [Actinorhabdospora filicis]
MSLPNFRRRGALITGIGAFPWTMIADLGPGNLPVGIASIVLALAAVFCAIRFGSRPGPARTPAEGWQRTFGRVGLMELAGIAVGVIALNLLGQPSLIPAAVALVVGAHFFPLAKVFGQPQYVWTGAGLCLAALAGAVLFALGQKDAAMAAAGLGTAATLWATSFHVSLRG